MEDDCSLNDEDYDRHSWLEGELWPKDGRVALPRMEGPEIQWPCTMLVISVLPVAARGWQQLATQAVCYTG